MMKFKVADGCWNCIYHKTGWSKYPCNTCWGKETEYSKHVNVPSELLTIAEHELERLPEESPISEHMIGIPPIAMRKAIDNALTTGTGAIKMEAVDPIDHPEHYANADIPSGIECWNWYELGMTEEEFRGAMKNNVFKYIWRVGRKDKAKSIQDLEKAIAYIKRWIKFEEGERIVWMKGSKAKD
jgi:hypothetical protein